MLNYLDITKNSSSLTANALNVKISKSQLLENLVIDDKVGENYVQRSDQRCFENY